MEDLSLSVEPGEFVVLLGPSGCGKSTLLRLIAGLEKPTSGSIFVGGRRVDHFPPGDRDVAMVFQSYALYAHLSVAGNISFPLKMRQWAWWYEIPLAGRLFPKRWAIEKEHSQKAEEAARTVGLEDYLDRRPRQLSGGQRQRVAVARAIVHNPEVFLMDEPLSNLDAQLRSQTRAEIMQLYRRLERTFLYVTHDQVEAMTMGTRVILMKEGKIQQDGTPRELFERPANVFVATFLGAPPMNVVPAKISGSSIVIEDQKLSNLSAVDREAWMREGADVLVGVRPEHIRVGSEGICGTVELVERLGTEQILSVTASGQRWQVRLPSTDDFSLGQIVNLSVEPNDLHGFDPETGERL